MPGRVTNGIVVSDKMDKTVLVKVERRFKHTMYKKYIWRTKKYAVHDEMNTCKIGDRVSIRECKPISKRKRWEIVAAPK